jgi:hypothetical protein
MLVAVVISMNGSRPNPPLMLLVKVYMDTGKYAAVDPSFPEPRGLRAVLGSLQPSMDDRTTQLPHPSSSTNAILSLKQRLQRDSMGPIYSQRSVDPVRSDTAPAPT